MPIGIHKSPGMIKKLSDNLYRACVKAFVRTFLPLLELSFVYLPVPVFAPTPVL